MLLSSRDPSTTKLVIADFGFARKLDDQSLASTLVGSPLYVAPELLDFKEYSSNADLWSVGCILYEMLTGEHPFLKVNGNEATNQLALRKNIATYFETHVSVSVPDVFASSSACVGLLSMLLQPDPDKRACFDDFFHSPFLLPVKPEADAEHSNSLHHLPNDNPGDDDFVLVDEVDICASERVPRKRDDQTACENTDDQAGSVLASTDNSNPVCVGISQPQNNDISESTSQSLLLIDDEDICWSCPQLPTTSVVDLEATTSVIPSVTSGSASFFADAPEAPKQYTAAGKEEHSVTSRDKIAFRQYSRFLGFALLIFSCMSGSALEI